MRVDVETSGFTAVEKRFLKAADSIQPKAVKVVKRTAFAIQRSAILAAPVDTGALVNSISVDLDTGGSIITADIGPTVDYAHYVEEGTSEMAGQPYMRPATEKHVPIMFAAFEKIAGDV